MKENYRLLIALMALAVLFIDPGSAHATPRLQVPEPATLTLLASGAALIGGISFLRKRKK